MGFFDFFKKKKNEDIKNKDELSEVLEDDIIEDEELKEIIDKEELEKEKGVFEKYAKKIFSNDEEMSLKEIENKENKEKSEEEKNNQDSQNNKDKEKEDKESFQESDKEVEETKANLETDNSEKENDAEKIDDKNQIEKEKEFDDSENDKAIDDSEDEKSEDEKSEDEKSDEEKKDGFLAKLTKGLLKTRDNIMAGIDGVFAAFTVIDEEMLEDLEEVLILADIGVNTSLEIIDNLRQRAKKENKTKPEEAKEILIEEISKILKSDENEREFKTPAVVMVIGVNGAGKTTTIGKLANIYKKENNSVLMAAGDTFRAAAIEQLEEWGKRTDVEVIRQMENSDPAAVIFDALRAAKARKTDVLICDTAGRLHNKKNLMDELEKINRIVDREFEEAHRETYLVLDATAGQNALQQAKLFSEVADITAIILTKLDGTAKGGVVIAIKAELDIPIKYIGVGEGIDDLQEFDSEAFAKALFE